MGFNIDLEKINLGMYEQLLLESSLVPSRMILKEHFGDYFELLAQQKIANVQELLKKLKNKKSITEMAEKTRIPAEYLTILARETKGYLRSSIKLTKFPGLMTMTTKQLAKLGITNTHQLFNEVLTPESRKALALKAGIELDEVLMITKLTDLTRVRWVNHTFAYVLYETGYDTAEKVAAADPEELYEKVKKLNAERKLFPAHIGLKDMKRCIEAAQLLSFDVEY